MHPEYNGVKYYGKEDLSLGWELKKAEPILSNFDNTKNYEDINEVIELYNIQQLMNTGVPLSSWSKDIYDNYRIIVGKFTSIIAKFFSEISDNEFTDYYEKTADLYTKDFWRIFSHFRLYKHISASTFEGFLEQHDNVLYEVLENKDLVKYYDVNLANVMRTSNCTVRILAAVFLEKSKSNYCIPDSLHPTEFEAIFQNYIQSNEVNSNILQLIFKAQSCKECPISDKLRLSAKKRFDRFWDEHKDTAVFTGSKIGVCFQKQEEIKSISSNGNDYQMSYDVQWLEESLDYPLLLNNFRFVFEMVDYWGRSTFPATKNQIGTLERLIRVDGKKFYEHGHSFIILDILSREQMALYYEFLYRHDIVLEDVFTWFFEVYLPEEFDVEGFSIIAPSPTSTYAEKCRNLAAEMDGLLKQYRMFVRDGEIDRELFEMSSEHMVINDIPSLILNKYAYSGGTDTENEMTALFSDQSMLAFIDKAPSTLCTLFDLLRQEKVSLNDLY